MWQDANAQAVREGTASTRGGSPPADRPLWFARSSGLTSPAVVPLFWLGDQLHSWDRNDGLASVVIAMLSSGLSGHALTHSDTGGYTTIKLPPIPRLPLPSYTRDLELLQRWSELSIFTAFFRTHEGSAPSLNVQPYDLEALSHFKRCAELFVSLAPYRTKLMSEARDRGWPLVRPLWLHHEDDPATRDLELQFLEGESLLVAPVLAPHATRVRAYLPAGNWRRAFAPNGTVTTSLGGWFDLDAPIGEPAALVRLDESTGRPPEELVPFLEAAGRGRKSS